MRWFIVLLLVSNVILFFWVEQESLRSSRHSSIPPPDVGRLRLLQEGVDNSEAEVPAPPEIGDVQRDAPKAEVQTPQHVDTVAESVPTDTSRAIPDAAVVDASSAQDVPAAAPEQVDEEPAFSVISDALTRLAEGFTSTGDAVVSGAGDEPPAVDEETTETITEDAQVAPGEVSEEQPPGSPLVEVEPVEQVEPAEPALASEYCGRVGPLRSADADKLLTSLPDGIELLSDTLAEQRKVDAYYVLILPLENRAAGRKKVRELNAAGLKDTWLFQRGEYRNGISLGVFSQQQGAQRHAALVAKKGFSAVVREKTSTAERRWLELRKQGDGDLRDALSLPNGVAFAPQTCP